MSCLAENEFFVTQNALHRPLSSKKTNEFNVFFFGKNPVYNL